MIHAMGLNADPEFDLRTQLCGLDRLRILAVEFPAEFRERRPGGKPGEEWRAQGDDYRTFLSDFVASLSEVEFPPELSL
jgi:hypothetical protein